MDVEQAFGYLEQFHSDFKFGVFIDKRFHQRLWLEGENICVKSKIQRFRWQWMMLKHDAAIYFLCICTCPHDQSVFCATTAKLVSRHTPHPRASTTSCQTKYI